MSAFALALVVVLVQAPTARAQPVLGFEKAQEWIRLARAHRVGHVDDPLKTLASWRQRDLQQIRQDIQFIKRLIAAAAKGEDQAQIPTAFIREGSVTRRETDRRVLRLGSLAPLLGLPDSALGMPLDPREVARPDRPPRLAIAKVMLQVAMLHTDLMTAPADQLAMTAAALSPHAVRVVDGQRTTVADLSVHWEIARYAIDLAAPVPAAGTIARDWFHATSEYLIAHRNYSAGMPHLEHGRAAMPADSRMALYLGAAFENLAAPQVQSALEEGEPVKVEPRDVLLKNAERHLRAAVELDPASTEAALRLGRVLELTGRAAEALGHLARAETGSTRRDIQYLAALFTGRAQESLDREAEARAAFERASQRFPAAQSPLIALSQLAWRASNPAGAMERIRMLPASSTGRAADPWWTYDVTVTTDVLIHFVELRAAVDGILR